jgi:hypothetical protein
MKQTFSDGVSAQERLAIYSGKSEGRGFGERHPALFGGAADSLGTALAHAAWFLIGFASALAFILAVTLAAA